MNHEGSSSDDPWFDDDGFWSAVEPVLFGSVRHDEARAEVAEIVRALDLRPPAMILDVFCGPGRHLVPLHERGFRVIGVDRTPRFVRAAKEALGRAAVSPASPDSAVLQCQIGVSDSSRPNQSPLNTTDVEVADLALWLGASAGYDGTEGDVQTLIWIRRHLASGALLLIEGPVAEDLTDAPFAPWEWFDERSPAGHTVAVWRLEHTRTDDGWLSGRWTRYQDGELRRHRFRYQVHGMDAWSEMLANAGFRLIQRTSILDRLNATTPSRSVTPPAEKLARSWLLACAD